MGIEGENARDADRRGDERAALAGLPWWRRHNWWILLCAFLLVVLTLLPILHFDRR